MKRFNRKPRKHTILIIRVLKELGIYKIYLESRYNCGYGYTVPNLSNDLSISQFIDQSLTWSQTGYRSLWCTLNLMLTNRMTDSSLSMLLEQPSEIERLTNEIKKNI